MLYGIACSRVNGMCIFPSAVVVEVAVVAACGHGNVREVEHRLQLAVHGETVFYRLVHADVPVLATGTPAVHHDLAAYLHHVFADALRL